MFGILTGLAHALAEDLVKHASLHSPLLLYRWEVGELCKAPAGDYGKTA